MSNLVGSIVERNSASSSRVPVNHAHNDNKTGFPRVQHRSKSAFARAREAKTGVTLDGPPRLDRPPTLGSTSHTSSDFNALTSETPQMNHAFHAPTQNEVEWRTQMSAQNDARVAAMSDAEREEEIADILSKFGPGTAEILKRAKAKRERDAQLTSTNDRPSEQVGLSLSLGNQQDTTTLEPAKNPSTNPGATSNSTPVTPPRPSVSIISNTSPPSARPSTPISALAGSRPSTPTVRSLRFVDPRPEDVHVYPSAPTSPKRKALLLGAPQEGDRDVISLGSYKSQATEKSIPKLRGNPIPKPTGPSSDVEVVNGADMDADDDSETPNAIRRRYFPSEPANNTSLEWMSPSFPNNVNTSRSADSSVTPPLGNDVPIHDLRLDLSGFPIPPSISSNLPSHLGLHHHAEGIHAGYTLQDIFLLARSTVRAQRSAMFRILLGLASWLPRHSQSREKPAAEVEELMNKLRPQEDELRRQMIALSLANIGERGGLGSQAIELLAICLVSWTRLSPVDVDMELQDLRPSPAGDAAETIRLKDPTATLPLEHLLPQISSLLKSGDLDPSSLLDILRVLIHLARYSNDYSEQITKTSHLLPQILKAFLLTPIPPSPTGPQPNPDALDLLNILARASRSNAVTLSEPADALLRFITTLPPSSPFGEDLATQLVTGTLRLYATLAQYGLYTSVCTAAFEPLSALKDWIVTSTSSPLKESTAGLCIVWAQLLEAWFTCATDPHQTTPPHALTWSQLCERGWEMDMIHFLQNEILPIEVQAAALHALSAYLEGAKINGVKGGQQEQSKIGAAVRASWSLERWTVAANRFLRLLDDPITHNQTPIDRLVAMEGPVSLLSGSVRLYLSISTSLEGAVDSEGHDASPLPIGVDILGNICATLARHPLWTAVRSPTAPAWAPSLLRPLSVFLGLYIRLARQLPGISATVWMAQAQIILERLQPGDEHIASGIQREIWGSTGAVARELAISIPGVLDANLGVAAPFWEDRLRLSTAKDDHLDENPSISSKTSVGPIHPTPALLTDYYTLRVPAISSSHGSSGLPLGRDWPFAPIHSLLRSGSATIFTSLPAEWDGDETQLVRASLILALVMREAQTRTRIRAAGTGLSRERILFGAMGVYMLEHGLPEGQDIGAGQVEVWREEGVSKLLHMLLAPYRFVTARDSTSYQASSGDSLENAGRSFLGPGTPFFQFWSDFVALFEATSFGDSTFAALVLPALAMRYPVDYRRLLWKDHAPALRLLRMSVAETLSDDLSEFMWPIEQDGDVIMGMLRALLKSEIAEGTRLRWVAVHHIAHSIWPDLSSSTENTNDTRDRGRLRSIVTQANFALVREIVGYWQPGEDAALLMPPKCFELDERKRVQRAQWVQEDASLWEKMRGLFVS